jgi:hypothetical protein
MAKKPRGWWNTSLRDKARAQYQADQIAAAVPAERPASQVELNEAFRRGWLEGREALRAELDSQGSASTP